MLTETFKELREKLSTQSAVADHMTGEVARLKGELETANSRLAANQARVDELSRFLHPATTGEITDILGWVDTRLQPAKSVDFATPDMYEPRCATFERGEHLLISIRQHPERSVDDTAINVLATALRSELDTAQKLRGEAATLKARAEKAEAELAAERRGNLDYIFQTHEIMQASKARVIEGEGQWQAWERKANSLEAELTAAQSRIATLESEQAAVAKVFREAMEDAVDGTGNVEAAHLLVSQRDNARVASDEVPKLFDRAAAALGKGGAE